MVEQLITIGLSILTTAVGVGVSWGVVKAKLSKLDEDRKEHAADIDNIKDKYTPIQYFKAVTHPMQVQLNEIQSDIKRILILLSETNRGKNSRH